MYTGWFGKQNYNMNLIDVGKILMSDRFIGKYGTHIIVGLSIGGQDVVLVRQDKSSNLEPSEMKRLLDELGDQLFTGTCSFTPNARDQKSKVINPVPIKYLICLFI